MKMDFRSSVNVVEARRETRGSKLEAGGIVR